MSLITSLACTTCEWRWSRHAAPAGAEQPAGQWQGIVSARAGSVAAWQHRGSRARFVACSPPGAPRCSNQKGGVVSAADSLRGTECSGHDVLGIKQTLSHQPFSTHADCPSTWVMQCAGAGSCAEGQEGGARCAEQPVQGAPLPAGPAARRPAGGLGGGCAEAPADSAVGSPRSLVAAAVSSCNLATA
jgi:hypothetical protein